MALNPRRLLALDAQKQTLTFAWKDYAQGAKHKTMTLELKEFVRRFCLHLLPKGFVKIRHFGFLSNRQRQTEVAQARALLQPRLPADSGTDTNPKLNLSAAADGAPLGRVCPYCGSNRLLLVEIVAPTGSHWSALPKLDSS